MLVKVFSQELYSCLININCLRKDGRIIVLICASIFFSSLVINFLAVFDGLWNHSPECKILPQVREILGIFGGRKYRAPEYELLSHVRGIFGAFVGLWYCSPECKLLYLVKESLGIFNVL
jgi:hypothetical protein